MSKRVLVVESYPSDFDEHWNSSEYGLGVQLEAINVDGREATVERVYSAADLLEVASEVKKSKFLPARALVFQSTFGTDINVNSVTQRRTQIEQPADYEEGLDPIWALRGNNDTPLALHARLIGSRLIRKAVPDVRFWPGFDIDTEDPSLSDIFHVIDDVGGVGVAYGPIYGGYLARINKHLSIADQPFMSLVDGMGGVLGTRQKRIEGTDVYASWVPETIPPIDFEYRGIVAHNMACRIGIVARLIKGEYPGATDRDTILEIPREQEVTV